MVEGIIYRGNIRERNARSLFTPYAHMKETNWKKKKKRDSSSAWNSYNRKLYTRVCANARKKKVDIY